MEALEKAKVAPTPGKPLAEAEAKVSPPHLPTSSLYPFFRRLQDRILWWRKNADPEVVNNIKYGIAPDWCSPYLPLLSIQKTAAEQLECLHLLSDYLQLGAVREVTPPEVKFLVPWFLIKKPEGGVPK